MKLIIYWCRRDFRLKDNPALYNSLKNLSIGDCFLPVFVLEEYMLEATSKFQFGYPSRYFLSQALPKFAEHFENFLLVSGQGAQTLINLEQFIRKELNKESEELQIEIHVNEDVYEDFYKQIIKLKKHGLTVKVYNDQLTVNKETLSGAGKKYSIFTPFKKAVWKEFLLSPVLEKVNLKNLNYLQANVLNKIPNKIAINNESIWDKFSKERNIEFYDYATGNKHNLNIDNILNFRPELNDWYFTENEAHKRLSNFVSEILIDYKENRDSLEKDLLGGKTSKLSLALCWGLLSARQIKQVIQEKFDNDFIEVNWFSEETKSGKIAGVYSYLSELIWREFYKYLLYHNSKLMNEEFQEKFRFKINWIEEKEAIKRFKAWISGATGYKIVDAAMMQLAKTGWMHNRSRMIVASVLTKNLGVDWRWGQEYFRAMLIDLDESSNNGGWQWGASVGADPKPIRIFNPYLQAENYDKSNAYQKKWLSEEVFLIDTQPIIEHKLARDEALKRYGLDKQIDKNGKPIIRDY